MDNNFLLTAVNAKYIHSNLAVRYIKQYCQNNIHNLSITEFSINDSLNHMIKKILLSNANIIAFSCYIWNIEIILKICASLKKANPELTIILGGPEVSFDAAEIMRRHPAIDYIVLGEGEASFLSLAKHLNGEIESLKEISGIAYRNNSTIIVNPSGDLICNLDDIPFPYEDLGSLDNKIIYYETNRGCPFNCQYCLSSTIAGVRYFSLERVKRDIRIFVEQQVPQVKLVDRTFNCHHSRCVEIIDYIIALNGNTNFHFEIAADLIDEAFLSAVEKAPSGMLQFEIGVQSTNDKTLKEIMRTMDFELVSKNVHRLAELNNAHIHLDLIAGLPYEDYDNFKKSFDDVYALQPDMLQLGFLKLLKGSGLRASAEKYQIIYHNFAPYEVIATQWLCYSELFKLKEIEHLVEVYYNSGKFRNSLKYIVRQCYSSPFSFFEQLALYWINRNAFDAPKSMNDLYTLLYEFMVDNSNAALEFNEWIKLDWLLYGGSGTMPKIIKRYDHASIKEKVHEFIKAPENRHLFGNNLFTYKELLKAIDYEVFYVDITKTPYAKQDTLVFFVSEKGRFSKSMKYFAVTLM